MKILQQLSLFVGGCALCLSTAMAAPPVNLPPDVSAGSVSVVPGPGAKAMPTVTFAFSSDYEFTTLLLNVDYSATLMTFNAAQSTLSVGGNEMPFLEVLATLSLNSGGDFTYTPNDAPGSYSLSAAFGSGHYTIPVGSMVLKGVFDLDPSFVAGTATDVFVSGTMTSTAADADPFPIDNFSVVATVTAVPEPETWLMLLGGLGLVAAAGRRRKLLQVSGSDSRLVAACC